MKIVQIFIFLILIAIGFADSVFLTYEHYALTNIGCPVSPWINCLAVTTSKYSEIFGIPLALFGVIYYLLMGIFVYFGRTSKMFRHFFIITSTFGALFSVYLIFVQAVLLKVFCAYCLLSAATSFLIFGFSLIFFEKEWKTVVLDTFGYAYTLVLRPIFWKIDAKTVHEGMTSFGEVLGRNDLIKKLFSFIFVKKHKNLKSTYHGIKFDNPVGLAAGFDYNAQITQISRHIDFGFQTVGTITNIEYAGNPAPQLGRLPKSKSLLVNKGYKNKGSLVISDKLSKFKKFDLPLGISIGRSNNSTLDTLESSIEDIVKSFKMFEKANAKNSYYELNISCPNIINAVHVSFYEPKNLEKLLSRVDRLRIKKPIFVKMPIDKSDREFKKMLDVIVKHKIKGVIIGNLQTNKEHKTLVKSEVRKFKMGNFSGKPTFEDSNRLIKLAYKSYKDRLTIIGCGGVFNSDDAWIKFTNGASLIQLITGMIFEGPQLIAQINRDLSERLTKKGYKSIKEIVGTAV